MIQSCSCSSHQHSCHAGFCPRRYLRSKGFCVVNILEKSWEEMSFQEQVSDLAVKVQQAQKQPTGKSFVGAKT